MYLKKKEIIMSKKPTKIKRLKKDSVYYVNNSEFYNEICEWMQPWFIKKKIKIKKILRNKPKNQWQNTIPLTTLPDCIGEKIYKIVTRFSYKPNFINYCVDEETECLTKNGWKKYDEISLKDTIMSYDYKDNELKWSQIHDIFINKNYNDKMHKLTIRGMDALVTPNHNFVTKENGLTKVEHLKCGDHLTLMGNELVSTEKIYSDNFVKLVGWFVTEGNILLGKTTNEITIFQKEGIHSKKIEQLLIETKSNYKKYYWNKQKTMIGFRVTKKMANDIIKLAPDKILSYEFINNLTSKQRMMLIETMVDGDGHTRNKEKKLWSYCQKDKNHIDNFIMLCSMSGLLTSTRLRTDIRGWTKHPYYSVNIYNHNKKQCNIENINFHGGRISYGGGKGKENNPNIPTIDYKGTVWCPQTNYGTFLCRRNGKTFITGNTYKDKLISEALYTCCRYANRFDPEKGQNPFAYFTRIASSAFIKCINEEKKASNIKKKIYDNVVHENQMINKNNLNNINIGRNIEVDRGDWTPLTVYNGKRKRIFKTEASYIKYCEKKRLKQQPSE